MTTVVRAKRRAYFRAFGADGHLRALLRPGMRVLDVGCSDGRGSEVLRDAAAYGVDIHRPALQQAVSEGRRVHGSQADARFLPYCEGGFDAVIALDVIEHFEKVDALAMIGEMERVSRDLVVLLTPNGFVPQAPTEDEPWQEHRCGFGPGELANLGYEVHGVGGVAFLRKPYGAFRSGPVGQALAFASRPVAAARPGAAFHLLAVRSTAA